MITINETLYKKMPEDIKLCFEQLPNPSAEEVRECFPETKPTKPHGGDGGKLDTQEMGFGFIGIERESDYCKIAEARISAWEKEPEQETLL